MNEQNPKRNSLVPFVTAAVLILIQFNSGVVGASDDITNIWYYGCRWFGGSVNMVSCNCTTEAKEMYIQQNAIAGYETSIIEINNCAQVRFGADCVRNLSNLRRIALNNIKSLVFERNSLHWIGYRDPRFVQEERFDLSIPSLKVIVRNSGVRAINSHSFAGRINEITLENTAVDNIEAFAFSNLLQMENLVFRNVALKDVKPQAFKKFGTEFMTLEGVSADSLPSRMFSDVTVYRRLTINDCHFNTLHPGTFIISNPTSFTVTNTRVKNLEGEAFIVTTTGDVVIKNNVFDKVHSNAFTGINLDTKEVTSGRTITFDTNTISTLEKRSLEVQPQFETRLINLNLNQTCDCDFIVSVFRQSHFYHEIQCLSTDGQYVTVREFKSKQCSPLTGYYTLIIIVCSLVLVLGLVGVAFYLYYRLVYRRQKYGCEKGGQPSLSLIVPDGRTYRETELHVIVEKADLLTTDL